jgi:hypothetical protein
MSTYEVSGHANVMAAAKQQLLRISSGTQLFVRAVEHDQSADDEHDQEDVILGESFSQRGKQSPGTRDDHRHDQYQLRDCSILSGYRWQLERFKEQNDQCHPEKHFHGFGKSGSRQKRDCHECQQ